MGKKPMRKNMCSAFVALCLLVGVPGVALNAEDIPPMVSMVAILADHERFEGTRIETVGVLEVSQYARGLCLSKSDARIKIAPNCIWLEYLPAKPLPSGQLVPESWVGKYVAVRGVVRSGRYGRWGSAPVALVEISDISIWYAETLDVQEGPSSGDGSGSE